MHSHCLNASDDVISNTRPSSQHKFGRVVALHGQQQRDFALKMRFSLFAVAPRPPGVREYEHAGGGRPRRFRACSRPLLFSRLPSTAATREVVMLSLLLSSPAVIFFFVPLCKSRITAISPHRLALKRFSRASRGCSSSRCASFLPSAQRYPSENPSFLLTLLSYYTEAGKMCQR